MKRDEQQRQQPQKPIHFAAVVGDVVVVDDVDDGG